MSYESNTGLGVNSHYGPRGTEAGVASGGEVHGSGVIREAVVYITGEDFGDGTTFDTQKIIPAGSKLIDAYAEVSEVFALGGTSPTINVGTSGSAATNRAIRLTEANAETAGQYYEGSGAGTFTSVLSADTTVAVEMGGTSPTVTSEGKAKVVIRYIKI